MSLKSRLAKLEYTSGINDPCVVCDAIERHGRRAGELAERLGIASEPKGKAMVLLTCKWCLRGKEYNLYSFTVSERALMEKMELAYESGTLCEHPTLHDEIEAMFERAFRRNRGAHYEQFQKLEAEWQSEFDRVIIGVVPRFHYLCRVPNCSCDHPKTDEEWERNVRASGLRAA